jgi:HEPN domain-containing protein
MNREAAAVNREADVRAWLEYAEADRRSARNAMAAADYRDVAFHCQQAAEKALKALIVHHIQDRPPYVHNLRELLSRLSMYALPSFVVEAVLTLNPHYRATRYPGVADDLDFYVAENAARLLEQMEQIWKWVLDQLP